MPNESQSPIDQANQVHRFVLWLWALVWRNYIDDGDRVVYVKGWRTAIIQGRRSGRTTITPMPLKTWINKRNIAKQKREAK